MRERKLVEAKKPVMLACALLEDGGRYLFLETKDLNDKSRFELPSVFVYAGENPLECLQKAILEQCGIDAHMRQAVIRGEYNAGSRKRKAAIPALGFTAGAKSLRAKVSQKFVSSRWMGVKESLECRLERKSEWLKTAKRTA